MSASETTTSATRAEPAARVRTSSSGAQTAAWPRPPARPQAALTSAAGRRHAGAAAPTARSCTAGLTAADATGACVSDRPSRSLRDVDADVVGEGEPTRHGLGRLGLALHEPDAAHGPSTFARAD